MRVGDWYETVHLKRIQQADRVCRHLVNTEVAN
ncbi:Uncharacterised protein [Mycobacteroides abscessus subsp. abscessus]|nr:Uncharacterised protein [Mycobacteroides abscessus subsp. abscessus]